MYVLNSLLPLRPVGPVKCTHHKNLETTMEVTTHEIGTQTLLTSMFLGGPRSVLKIRGTKSWYPRHCKLIPRQSNAELDSANSSQSSGIAIDELGASSSNNSQNSTDVATNTPQIASTSHDLLKRPKCIMPFNPNSVILANPTRELLSMPEMLVFAIPQGQSINGAMRFVMADPRQGVPKGAKFVMLASRENGNSILVNLRLFRDGMPRYLMARQQQLALASCTMPPLPRGLQNVSFLM